MGNEKLGFPNEPRFFKKYGSGIYMTNELSGRRREGLKTIFEKGKITNAEYAKTFKISGIQPQMIYQV